MKKSKYLLLAITAVIAFPSFSQEIAQKLKPFDKIIASPRINLILEEGDHEEIRLVYNEVSADKINIRVKGKTLRIYLDDAKVTEKMERVSHNQKRSIYADVSVTAYVTYRSLNHLEIRGNQELTCKDALEAEVFTLKAYGENEINLASVKTDYLKASLYGENDLEIKGGKAEYQKYRLFGDNKIDTQELNSYATITNIYGESKVKLTTQDELKVNAFGEPEVFYQGNAQVNKGLVFGRAQIRKLN
jgi:hypothetical protein